MTATDYSHTSGVKLMLCGDVAAEAEQAAVDGVRGNADWQTLDTQFQQLPAAQQSLCVASAVVALLEPGA